MLKNITTISAIITLGLVLGFSVPDNQHPDLKPLIQRNYYVNDNGSAVPVRYKNEKYIITCWHVVDDRNIGDNINITQLSANYNTISFNGKLIATLEEHDLALIKPDHQESIGYANRIFDEEIPINFGDRYYCVGNPADMKNILSVGYINGEHCTCESKEQNINICDLICTSGPSYNGFSGSGLYKYCAGDFRLIGIRNISMTHTRQFGYAIPVHKIKKFITENVN